MGVAFPAVILRCVARRLYRGVRAARAPLPPHMGLLFDGDVATLETSVTRR